MAKSSSALPPFGSKSYTYQAGKFPLETNQPMKKKTPKDTTI